MPVSDFPLPPPTSLRTPGVGEGAEPPAGGSGGSIKPTCSIPGQEFSLFATSWER